MALVKNFSDETGKGGNPGRFTGHLAQVERTGGGIGDIRLPDIVHLKGSCTGPERGEAVLPVQVVALSALLQPRTHTQTQVCTHIHACTSF